MDLDSFQARHKDLSQILADLKSFRFVKLTALAIKVFFCVEVTAAELEALSETERQLLVLILKKKKVHNWKKAKPTFEFLEAARRTPNPKREEESIKFILKKINRFLQGMFRSQVYSEVSKWLHPDIENLNDEMSSFQYSYVGFYYEYIASQTNLHIEAFFHPRMNHPFKSLKSHFIPKTISRLTISLSRLNKRYCRDAEIYLDRFLMDEIRSNISFKLESMLHQWAVLDVQKGSEWLIDHIKKDFINNSKAKLAWGVDQVAEGVKQLKKMIAKIE